MVTSSKDLTRKVCNLIVEPVKFDRSPKKVYKQFHIRQRGVSRLVKNEKTYRDLRDLPCMATLEKTTDHYCLLYKGMLYFGCVTHGFPYSPVLSGNNSPHLSMV